VNKPTIVASPPRLLVSVRSVAEARAAFSGGCDILDVKEPGRGSLGMADVETIAAVLRDVESLQSAAGTPVSAALGEVVDWLPLGETPALPAELHYVKLGPAGISSHAEWSRRWRQVRQGFEEASGAAFRWIAVAYADWQLARAPRPEAVTDWAVAAGCTGLLLDTHTKTDRTVLDFVSPDELKRLARRVQDHGLILAVAGRLHAALLPEIAAALPDIVAIRTAGCRDGQRSGEIDARAVRDFKTSLTAAFGGSVQVHAKIHSNGLPSTVPHDSSTKPTHSETPRRYLQRLKSNQNVIK